jgi:hypothetical protein
MSLYWLCYRHNNQISVVIEPGASLVHAKMRAALADLDEGEFSGRISGFNKTEIDLMCPGMAGWEAEVQRLVLALAVTAHRRPGHKP